MRVDQLTLQKFRTYEKQIFSFSPSVTLIIGPNAIGKTNILEAMYCLATGKSFRAEKDSDMIFWQQDVARIKSKLKTSHFAEASRDKQNSKRENSEDTIELELVLTTGMVQGQKAPMKKYLVNGVPRRHIDFVGNLKAVHFCPEDLELVTDSPSIRRNYLNSVLSQVDREYRRNLVSYEKGLRQRNAILERINEGQAQKSQLLFWDQLLIKTGNYITQSRQAFIDTINAYTVDNLTYRLTYDPSFISESRLLQYKEEEVSAKMTLVGPQRDNFSFEKSTGFRESKDKLKERFPESLSYTDMARFGSRGEQRLAVLWLKLAELEFIADRSREEGSGSARPVLLLDDIFSELDEQSRNLVLSMVDQQQTIITSTEEDVVRLFTSKNNVEMIRLPIK